MTNDGRAFFATDDALVHGDTNEAQDVYEYVDGRPQLITTGTGETSVAGRLRLGRLRPARAGRGQRRRPRRLLLDLRHAGQPGPQRPLPQVLRRPRRRRLPRPAAAAALRSRRRVPRRRQLAAGGHRRTAPAPTLGAAATLSQARKPAKRKKKRQRTAAPQAHAPHHAPADRGGSGDEAASSSHRGAWPCVARRRCGLCSRRRRRGRTRRSPPSRPCPSTTQAGGHPDLEVQFAVENRVAPAQPEPLQLRGRQRRRPSTSRRVHRQPPRDPAVHDRRLLRRRLPDRLAGRDRQRRSRPTGSRFDAAVYNLVPPPDVAGLLGFKIFLFDTPQFTVLSARTGSDYGLDATATSIFHGCFPLQTLPAGPLGGAGRPEPRPAAPQRRGQSRGGLRPTSDTLCDANGSLEHRPIRTRSSNPAITNFRRLASNSPLTPFLQNPTTCDGPLSSLARRPLLRRRHRPRRRPLAADDRLRPAQLQPEPLRAADHDRDRLGLRDRRRPQRPPAAEPDDPLAVRDARRRPSPCRRASRSTPTPPTARPPAPTPKRNFGTDAKRPTAPSSPRSAASRSTARPCPARCPASSTSASRCPATATGSSSSPTASPPTSSWRDGHPRPADRPAGDLLHRTCRRAR